MVKATVSPTYFLGLGVWLWHLKKTSVADSYGTVSVNVVRFHNRFVEWCLKECQTLGEFHCGFASWAFTNYSTSCFLLRCEKYGLPGCSGVSIASNRSPSMCFPTWFLEYFYIFVLKLHNPTLMLQVSYSESCFFLGGVGEKVLTPNNKVLSGEWSESIRQIRLQALQKW